MKENGTAQPKILITVHYIQFTLIHHFRLLQKSSGVVVAIAHAAS